MIIKTYKKIDSSIIFHYRNTENFPLENIESPCMSVFYPKFRWQYSYETVLI